MRRWFATTARAVEALLGSGMGAAKDFQLFIRSGAGVGWIGADGKPHTEIYAAEPAP